MAGFHIHLAIAKRYAEKNNIRETAELYRGTVAPDLVDNKSISHYSGQQDNTKLIEYLANKIGLYDYLKNHTVDNDYEIGVFLHLVTDYLFFNNFIDKGYLGKVTYADFCKDLYTSYDITNDYLLEKYKIDFGELRETLESNISKSKKDKKTENSVGNTIFSTEQLDSFIEYVSNIDLKQYEEKIRKAKCNILP